MQQQLSAVVVEVVDAVADTLCLTLSSVLQKPTERRRWDWRGGCSVVRW
jgi:hypothetical protein